jgi:hypothetical protein
MAMTRAKASQVTAKLDATGSTVRGLDDKLREFVSVKDFGAVGDGVTDDTAELQNALNTTNVHINEGTYASAELTVLSDSVITAYPRSLLYHTTNSGNGLNADASTNIVVKDVSVDMGYSRGMTSAGHGMRFRGSNVTVENAKVIDFSFSGSGGGTGALFTPASGRLSGIRLKDSSFVADPTGQQAFGWLFDDTDTSFATNIYAKNIIGNDNGTAYAHELKNDSQFNYIGGVIAENSSVALGYGQTTVGTDGADKNLAMGIVAKSCAVGWLIGEGQYNATVGVVHDPSSAPALPAAKYAIRYDLDSSFNASWAVMSCGAPTAAVRYATGVTNSYAQVAAMGTGDITDVTAGVSRTVTEISHPGARNSIFAALDDQSGNSTRGSSANVAFCHATGERIGSLSGVYHDKLEDAGAIFNSTHYWRKEALTNVIESYATNGTSGNTVGFAHATPATNIRGAFWHVLGASSTGDSFAWRGWGLTGTVYQMTSSQFSPAVARDGLASLGSASARWSEVFAVNGTINTSDQRSKQDIESLTAAELRVASALKGLVKKFRFKDAVKTKGDAARTHIGVIAQEVIAAFQSEGLDAMRYGIICYDEWGETPERLGADGEVLDAYTPAGNCYGVRYEELLAFIIAAL